MLKFLLTDEVAEKYSWFGNRDKKNFSALKISQVIIGMYLKHVNKIYNAKFASAFMYNANDF